MATTSIWRVNGWLGKVLIYIENPDKTENPDFFEKQDMDGKEAQGLSDVIEYAVQQQKTGKTVESEGETVMRQFVSGVNCSPSTARDEMIAVKKRFGKEDGTVAYHGYQSFAPGEATPELAHEIGLALAKKLWGEKYQVLVATHLDRENHLHNHFVVNTVSFVDGIKYHRTEQDYFDMQRESDRLCREYGLSVIENPQRGKSKHYGEWRAEQEGRPTYLSLIKADVDAAIRQSMTERQFFYHLRQMGYEVKVGKDITVRPYDRPHGRKLARNFGEGYSLENIRRRILAQSRPQREHRPEPFRCRLHGDLKQAKKATGFRALYFHYCYLLGVFPKKQNRQTGHVPHALREDLIRAEELTDEARLLSRHRIDTLEQLNAYQADVESRLSSIMEQRKSLYRKQRTKAVLDDPAQQEQIRTEIATLTAQIKELRREVKLCGDIALRSVSIKDKIRAAREEQQAGKTEKGRLEPGKAYRREDGSVGQNFYAKEVYDISQTTARDQVQPQVRYDDRLLLKGLIASSPVPIRAVEELPQGRGAMFSAEQNAILVKKGMDAPDIFRCVSLEVANVQLAQSMDGYSRETDGYKAYAVSYMLCKRYGVDAKEYEISKLDGVFQGQVPREDIPAALTDMRDTFKSLNGRMARAMGLTRDSKQKEQER